MNTNSYFLSLFICFLFACSNPQSHENPLDGQWIDLSYAFDENTIYWPTSDGFRLDTVSEGMTENGYYYSAFSFCMAEHGGTHLDAPIHFSEGKQTVDEIPLKNLIGEAIIIDVSENAIGNRDYQITIGDVTSWETEFGPLPEECILLFKTGYGDYWPDREKYLGTEEKGIEAIPLLHFPGIHPKLAEWVVHSGKVKAVGLDTPSIDFGQSKLFESHRILFDANIPAFENVANLDLLPTIGAYVIALPLKIRNGSGGPVRIIARLP